MSSQPPNYPEFSDSEFDLRMRAEMALAFDPSVPPAHLMRSPPFWRSRRSVVHAIIALVLATTGMGTVLAMRPSAIVRDAIEHEAHERTLRGSAMDPQQLIDHLGLNKTKALPGFPQLMRVCDIDGRIAYHLTTYFDQGGMVTFLAFEQPVALKESSGWWSGVHWRVIRSQQGKQLLLISAREDALNMAQISLEQQNG